ncbi:hypothetical protein WJX79_003261 [Trebouxia sp. C0005]|nr:MAG: hypothetical protein FRX49_04389 [Trebouxia sp. A1-2]
MPVESGKLKLNLKGGTPWIEKKKKKKKIKAPEADAEPAAEDVPAEAARAGPTTTTGGKLDPTAVSVQSGKTYEQEFAPEIERAQTGKSKTTPWGSGYRPAPPLLHGYKRIVTGENASERLDMRAAVKADKFCK